MFFYPFWSEIGYQFWPFWAEIEYGLDTLVLNWVCFLEEAISSFGDKTISILMWSKPRMFCNESLGKIKFRAFLKGVGPWILSLEIVDYFGTSEHWVVEKK